ncbi:MAG: family 43 glycosylhydrolase [Candidatus Sulfotelmatobacter sp.]
MNLRNAVPTAFCLLLCSLPIPLALGQHSVDAVRRDKTYCNPIDLPYRFQLESPSRREAADPTMIGFRGEYWLFPSKSGGYFHSPDLMHWSFVEAHGYPVEHYAPTALVMNDKIYLTSGDGTTKVYVTDNPLSGNWTVAGDLGTGYGDPDLFLDDERLYMYDGVSGKDVLRATELDPHTFQKLRQVEIPQSRSKETRGWEVPGDTNNSSQADSWIEGSWMNKHDGTYYLQYSGPGTQFKTYGDGVLTSKNPMGPFTYAPYSPFSFKPTGFISGAGHSSTFAAQDGRFWHISTMTISVRHMFERRLGLFPSHFTKDGELATDTYLGDYPHYIDGDRGLVGWMLLSRKKGVTASSALEGHEAEKAVDEDVRTWWSAKTGDAGEWFQIDLGGAKTVEALQINFADEGSTALGRSTDAYQYVLEVSSDAKSWHTAVDHSQTGKDSPDDYEVLPQSIRARYVRIRNIHSPNGAKFSLSGLRVFGKGTTRLPNRVESIQAERDSSDPRRATVHWRPAERTEFYIVRIGTTPNELTQNYQVYDGATSLDVHSLNSGVRYYVLIDAVNESGIVRGTTTISLR